MADASKDKRIEVARHKLQPGVIVREDSNGQSIETSGSDRVSVIILTYNVVPYIAETLKSVFARTQPAFEVIVINDGSPDTEKLEEVLESFGDRIIYLKQENRGLSGAGNTGILKPKVTLSHYSTETIFGCRGTLKRRRNFCDVIPSTISCTATQCFSATQSLKARNS